MASQALPVYFPEPQTSPEPERQLHDVTGEMLCPLCRASTKRRGQHCFCGRELVSEWELELREGLSGIPPGLGAADQYARWRKTAQSAAVFLEILRLRSSTAA